MTIRIPRPVNRALDTTSSHPRAVSALVVGAAMSVPLALLWESPHAAILTGCGLLLYVVTAVLGARESRLRETIRQLRYDLAAERREVERLRQGDPSAPTAQLHTIGDRGEGL